MNGAFYIGAIGLTSQQKALDTVANNISNMNTHGFKRSTVSFSEVLSSTSPSDILSSEFSVSPDYSGVKAHSNFNISEQGEIIGTQNALDIAIRGEGMIELLGGQGQSYLWRGGRLAVNEDGFLAAENGMALRDQISIPRESASLEISTNGMVRAFYNDGSEPDVIGQINMVLIGSQNGLERQSGGVYKVNPDANLFDVQPDTEGAGQIIQGHVERSNVEMNQEMIDLMIIQRAYTANSKVLQAADELVTIANNLRR